MKSCSLIFLIIFSVKILANIQVRDLLTADVQFYLEHLGYRPGDKSGFIGPITHRAIRQYQTDFGLEVNGKVDQILLQHLRKTYFTGRKSNLNSDESYPLRGELIIRISKEHIRDCRVALESVAELARESAKHTANLANIESIHEYNPYLHEYLVIPPEVGDRMQSLNQKLDDLDYKLWKATRFCERLSRQPQKPITSK